MTIKSLTEKEANQVFGGFGPLGMALGALAGGIGQAASGADAKGIAAGIVFGGLSGLTGGLAAATTGFARVGWSVRSVGTAVISGTNMNTDVELTESK